MKTRRFLACFLLLVGAGALQAEELFSPKHVAKLQRVSSAVIAPDGKHVAFGLSIQRDPLKDKDGSAWTELHVVDREGHSRPFIVGEVNVGGLQWTPDGKSIAYTAKRHDDKQTALYAIPIDGGESRKLYEHETSISGVAFCPADSRIAFIATPKKAAAREAYEDKGFDQEIYEEQLRNRQVWIVDPTQDGKPRVIELEGSARAVAWSPNGKKLMVVVAPTPLIDDSYMYQRIRIVDADTGRLTGRVENPGKLGLVQWSPDSKHLAMISAVDIHDPSEGHLFVVRVPGDGEMDDLMPSYEAQVEDFEWADADTIAFVASERQHTTVGTVTLGGAVNKVIEASGPVLGGMTRADDGTLCFTGHTATHPPEVMVLPPGASELTKLTDVNPWLSKMRFAKQEVFKWKASDGLDLEGVLIYPLNHEEGIRYPMIMCVHGGPESHVSDGWITSYSYAGQVGAARGFVVFYPNYRGSTGRGVAFSKMGQGDAAGKEFDDLVDGVDALVARGLVDKDKVGITGGSYGGYASAWGATYYSDRYAASVMFVGISDNVSKYGTTDIPKEMFLVHQLKQLWDDWEFYLQRSPIRHVQNNKTPTLILHGKNDPRVHPSQSLELYRHLKVLGQAPVRLVLYEGEGHGNRKAAARLDYNLRMLRWMEQYLQGDGGPAPEAAIDYEAALQE